MKNCSKFSFFLASKKYDAYSVTFSLIATILGASSVIGLIEESANIGLPALWWLFAGSIGLAVLYLIISKINIENYYSISEFFGNVYGESYRRLSASLIVIAWTGIISAQYVAMGKVFEVILNLNPSTGIILSALVVFLYTSVKGQSSVVFTDKLQLYIILLGIMLIFFQIDSRLIKHAFYSAEFSDLFKFPVNSKFNYISLITMLFAVGITYIIGPDIYSRLLVAKDKNIAKKSVLLSSLIIFAVAILLVSIGINLRITLNIKKDFLYYFFSGQNIFIKFLFSLFVFCIIGSSADTCVMTSSTLIVNDIFKIKEVSGNPVKYARISMLIISLVSIVIAVISPFIIKNILWAYKMFSLSFFTPFICVFIFKLILSEKKLLMLNIFVILLFLTINFYNQSWSFIISSLIYFIIYILWSKLSK